MAGDCQVLTEFSPTVQQGDIIKDVPYLEYALEDNGVVEFATIIFPWVTVLSQSCDMEGDHRTRWEEERPPPNDDKRLLSVLVAPMYNAKHVYAGTHLEELGLTMGTISENKTHGNNIKNNCDPRYHHLSFPDGIQAPSLIIDFKHYFSVNAELLRKAKRVGFVGQLAPLYREDVSQRFAAFLARIGLP